MENTQKNLCNERLSELNSSLRNNLIETKIITIDCWNEEIAPRLSNLALAIDDVPVTARTFRLPNNYFEEVPA